MTDLHPSIPPPVPLASAFVPMPGVGLAPIRRTTSLPSESDLADWQTLLQTWDVQASRIASPDLIAQIDQSRKNKIDTLICSVLDTDPSVPFNVILADTFRIELAAGLQILSQLISPARTWVTADPDRTSDWYSGVARQMKSAAVRLVPLRGDYPQTDPTLMLHTLLQRKLSPGKLPTEKRVLLLDAAAAVAIGRCVVYESPQRVTPLAIRDHFHRKTHLVLAPLPTSLGEVCDFLDLNQPDAVFRAGDFLRDQWITRDTTLGHGELVVHMTAKQLAANPDPCIHCGWCLEACPTRIHPAGLLDAAQHHDPSAGKQYGVDACIECGICSYVCPTRLPILEAIRGLRKSAVK